MCSQNDVKYYITIGQVDCLVIYVHSVSVNTLYFCLLENFTTKLLFEKIHLCE